MVLKNSANYAPTQYDVLVGGANNAISNITPGTSGTILQSAGSSNPTYSTATYPATAGTNGNVLQSNGTNFSSATITAPGMDYITTITASNSASIAFTSTYITSKYTTYKIILKNIVPVASSAILECVMSTDNGSTYITTSYLSGINTIQSGDTSQNHSASTTYVYLGTTSNSTALGLCGDVNFYGLPVTIVKFTCGLCFAAAKNIQVYSYQPGTSAVNNLKFLLSSGNISSGTISLYGIY